MNGAETEQPLGLVDVLDRLADKAEGERVSLGELLDAFGKRAFGPMLLVPAFIALAPTGAIPGMSIVTGSLIIVIAGQMLLPIDHPWFPERLQKIGLDRELFDKSIKKARPWTEKLGKVVGPRLEFMVQPPLSYAVALVCIAMAALMFPLALLPFAVALPAATIVILALGLTAHDGLLIALGLVGAAAGAYFGVGLLG